MKTFFRIFFIFNAAQQAPKRPTSITPQNISVPDFASAFIAKKVKGIQ